MEEKCMSARNYSSDECESGKDRDWEMYLFFVDARPVDANLILSIIAIMVILYG